MMIPFHYRCCDCNRTFERDEVRYLCPDCSAKWKYGEPLRGVREVVFDAEKFRESASRDWNGIETFLPIESKYQFPFAYGNTPFFKAHRLGGQLGYNELWLKNDSLNPSGSLKDRASYLVTGEALRLHEPIIVAASTGNAASALAATSAAAGLRAVIFVPVSAPKAKLIQMLVCGATIVPVRGDYDDAFRLSIEFTNQYCGLNRNTAYNPLTIEGKKSAGLEIFYQLKRKVPDAIIIPIGDGVILHGIAKAFNDLLYAGLIDRLPRLIGVQATGSQAIHRFVTSGMYESLTETETIADSIAVRVPANAYQARNAVIASNGFTVVVSDDEILAAQKLLARTEGIFAEPAAVSVIAALDTPALKSKLSFYERIVALITGHGLKDIPAAMTGLSVVPESIEPVLSAIPPRLLKDIRSASR